MSPETSVFRERGRPTVPARRSRTLEWGRCLKQILDRNGAIEIAVAREYDENETAGSHLMWRVRLLALDESEIIVEQPMTLGKPIELQQGLELVAVMAVGQNRWMFSTTNLGATTHRISNRREVSALRLIMPTSVERCQRRNYYRVDTVGVTLPQVDVWPLLEPESVMLAERCNEIMFLDHDLKGECGSDQTFSEKDMMPEVGPQFTALLMNLGGGGVGLRVEPEDAQILGRHKLFWLRMGLPPELAAPVCATAKVVHTHIESAGFTYAGVAFDFSFNPSHQRFVVDQICRYIAIQQRAQLQRQAGDTGELRRSA